MRETAWAGQRPSAVVGCSPVPVARWLRLGFDSNFAFLWVVVVGPSLILLLRHPCPCPARCTCWLASRTFAVCILLRSSSSCVGLRCSRSPPRQLAGSRPLLTLPEKSCYCPPLFPAADVSSTSHRPVTLFGRVVFSNARLGLAKHDVPTAPPRMLHTGEDTP